MEVTVELFFLKGATLELSQPLLLELIYSSWLWFWKNQTREGESLNNRTITNLNGN